MAHCVLEVSATGLNAFFFQCCPNPLWLTRDEQHSGSKTAGEEGAMEAGLCGIRTDRTSESLPSRLHAFHQSTSCVTKLVCCKRMFSSHLIDRLSNTHNISQLSPRHPGSDRAFYGLEELFSGRDQRQRQVPGQSCRKGRPYNRALRLHHCRPL
jgi:hypothetical protein